jgi:hypothetical protein
MKLTPAGKFRGFVVPDENMAAWDLSVCFNGYRPGAILAGAEGME